MRIFCAVRHSADPRFYEGEHWDRQFYPPLLELGHELVISKVDRRPASEFMEVAEDFTPEQRAVRGDITQRIVDEVKQAHAEQPIDLFLCYFYNAHFDPAAFDDLHRLGIRTVNFFCNSMYQFELVAAIAAKVNHSWHAELHARERYLEVGANPVYVQLGASPYMCFPAPNLPRLPRSCFVGYRYADRDRWVAALVQRQVPIDVYGSGWLPTEPTHNPSYGRAAAPAGSTVSYWNAIRHNWHRHGWLAGSWRSARQWAYRRETRRLTPLVQGVAKGRVASIPKTFGQYEVVLNFANVWSDGRPGSNLLAHVRYRDFEAPMCRTCYLTAYTDEIELFYRLGQEIDTYRTPDELADKVNYYLKHPAAAERLREAGYHRAIRDHRWLNRFQELFQKIGLAA